MVNIVENPVETTFEKAIHDYKGYCIGIQVMDASSTCTFRVKVMLYSDDVPDEEFIREEHRLGVHQVMWANPDGMLFPTREELGTDERITF